jgi:hypothetical protein
MDMEWFDRARVIVVKFTEIGVSLLALGIILQLLFGSATPLLGADIAGNIMAFIKGLGGQGFVGLIAIGVVLFILNRK